ncbi:unnamed protein product [Paramecium sonneborni]|uniref:Uncharacterized protein n=1 Tax=Paramecium sonneborni TaxID=65129 RepID=A0A8S1R7C3_9CILI|nr:unnamed protein product [Paramecium sonneborni]
MPNIQSNNNSSSMQQTCLRSQKMRNLSGDNDGSEYGCKNNVSNCIFYQNKCLSKTSLALYTFQDNVGIENEKLFWCEKVIDSNDNKCKYDGIKCANRLCSDSATASFYTDFDYKSYLKTCKTDDYGCVDTSSSCNTVSGNQAFREQMLDNSGNDYYKSNTAVVTYGNCQVRTFYDNVFAKSDRYCNIWMKDCVTRENVVYRKIDLVLNIEVQKLNVKHSNSIHIMKMPTKLMYIYYVLECHPIRRIVTVKIESAQTIQLQLQMMNANLIWMDVQQKEQDVFRNFSIAQLTEELEILVVTLWNQVAMIIVTMQKMQQKHQTAKSRIVAIFKELTTKTVTMK